MSDEDLSSLHTRPSLLFRLRDWKDSSSWTEFYGLYRKLVIGLARRSGLGHSEAEEVVQDVFKRVAETIHEFEANPERGSFRGWLMNLTRWRITDKFRERQKHELQGAGGQDPQSDRTSTINRVPNPGDPNEEWESEWRLHVLDAAVERLARRVKAKHFQIFDLYARKHWPVLRVARELSINPASVYLISHRLTKQLKAEVEALQAQLD